MLNKKEQYKPVAAEFEPTISFTITEPISRSATMKKFLTAIILTIATITIQSAAYAGDSDDLSDYGLDVGKRTVFKILKDPKTKKNRFEEIGSLQIRALDMDDTYKSNDGDQIFVHVKAWNEDRVLVEGWIAKPVKKGSATKKSKKSRRSSCCDGTSSQILVINNGSSSNSGSDRYYRGPIYFSADNRSTVNNNITSPTPAPAPAQRPPVRVCSYCGETPRYSGGLAYCPNGNGLLGRAPAPAPTTSHYRYHYYRYHYYRYNRYNNGYSFGYVR